MAKIKFTRMYTHVLLLILFLFMTPCSSQKNKIIKNQEYIIQNIEKLRTNIDSLLLRYNIPGASIAIATKDSMIYCGSFGYANIELETPINENTFFHVGSIAKSFVALGILKLVEEGRIDLQSPVKQILPEIDINNPWEDTDPVRVVHLLEHTAGLNDPHFNDYYLDGDPAVPLLEGLKVSNHYLQLKWKPGAYRSYSSAGYMIAGIIIEKITGEKFEDYLKKEILEPLGMTTSTFRLTSETEKLLAQGYKANYKPSQYWYTYSRPAGYMISSASEMAKFLQFMLNKGKVGNEQVIDESAIDRMERSTTDPAALAGLEGRPGLGIGVGYYNGFKWYMHHGSLMGYCGSYGYSRDIGVGCVLLTNRWDVDFETGIKKVWNAFRDYLVKDFENISQTPPEPNIPVETLKQYTGYYKWCNPPQQLSAWIDLILNYQIVKLEGGSLYNKNVYFGSWKPLFPVTENTFRDKNELHASKIFIKTSDNKFGLIKGGGFYKRTYWLKPWLHGILFCLSWIIMLSSILYAFVWIPIDLYKRVTKKNNRSKYLRIRILPLLAVIIILSSFTLVGMQVNQSLAYIGQKTLVNVLFYVSTLCFAILSFLSLLFSIKSFKKPVKIVSRLYALILSLSCVGTTLYWGYWGFIGLKLWAY